MKRIICFITMFILVSSAAAMSISGLEHEIQFDDDSSQIGREEIRSLVDWKIKSVEMGGIDYVVFLYKDNQYRIDSNLVEKRREAIVSLMNTLGVKITKVVIVDQQSKRRELGLSKKQTNAASIIFQPPCTESHDCGPQPIRGPKQSELNK